MTIAKCTENGSNPPKFDLILIEGGYEGGETHNPYIVFSLPDECWGGEYADVGTFYVELEDLFKEFMKTYWDNSHGELTPRLIKMLHEYADRINQDLEQRLKEKGKMI